MSGGSTPLRTWSTLDSKDSWCAGQGEAVCRVRMLDRKVSIVPSAYHQLRDSGIQRTEDTALHPSVSRTSKAIVELTSLVWLKCDDRRRSLMYHFTRTFTEPASQAHRMTSDGSSTIPW